MTEPLRILLIEDSETDAKLVINEVRRIREPVHFERVQDVAALRTALTGRAWDLIICDWSLPALNAPTALHLVRETALDVPFIIVSGTVGEEAAVEAMRNGAHDYVLKDKLARLGPAIERELRDHAERLARRKSDQEVRAAEKAALASTAMLRAIIDSVGDGILVADRNGNFIHWNTAASLLMKMGPPIAEMAKVESQRIGLFRADKTTPISLEELPLTRAMRGESIDGAEIFFRPDTAPDGLWLNVNARPLRGEGLEGGGVAVFRDVSAAKAAQAQLMVADRMVSVGTLAAGVAHEINNPLAVLIANLGFAAKAIADAGTDALGLRELLSDAQEAAERIRMVVRDLKLFSRADEDKRGPVDVRPVMESTLRMAWNEIRFRARLVKDYGVVPMVDANESRLGQVFMNLVVNAAQAIPEGNANKNEIRITTKLAPSGKVVVEIRDTGTGIPPDVVSRIFEPFFTTKPVGVGTGLGLSICRNLITAMGGEIQVESRVSVGTVFRIVLPASAGEGDVTFTKTIIPTGRRGRILVVDDEPALGKALHRVISQDHDVEVMTSGKEALARVVAGERYDIILCDVMMPEMNGMDLYEALARVDAASAQRMIFITGGAFTQRAREFLSRVPNQRLEKPFDEQGLRHTLRALIT